MDDMEGDEDDFDYSFEDGQELSYCDTECLDEVMEDCDFDEECMMETLLEMVCDADCQEQVAADCTDEDEVLDEECVEDALELLVFEGIMDDEDDDEDDEDGEDGDD